MAARRKVLLGMTLAMFAIAITAIATFLIAANLAAARLPLCGPSRIDAANLWCREGAALMQLAMLEAGVAVALGLATLWLVRRRSDANVAVAQPA